MPCSRIGARGVFLTAGSKGEGVDLARSFVRWSENQAFSGEL